MAIYSKTTKELMHEFASQRLSPGDLFGKTEVVRWFSDNYPNIKSNTVALHVDGMSVNSRSRKHHPHIRRDTGWDLFYKLNSREFRLWNPATDGSPIYKPEIDAEDLATDLIGDPEKDDDIDIPYPQDSGQFAFEKDLQNYLAKNIGALEPGLKLYEHEDGLYSAIEFPAGGRYIDILAEGSDGALVIVETKVSKAYDRVVGQVMRYMAWIKANVANGRPVRGIIVASNISEDLKMATSMISNIRLVEYEISFSLKPLD